METSRIEGPRANLPLREGGAVLLAATAVYVLLALATYSPLDPTWGLEYSDQLISNLVGLSGATVAGAVFHVLGYVAYLIPLTLSCAVAALFIRRDFTWGWARFGLYVGGIFASTLSACVLVQLHVDPGVLRHVGSGGFLGQSLVEIGLPFLKPAGMTLIAFVGLLIGVQSIMATSWIRVAEVCGRWIYACWIALSTIARAIYTGLSFTYSVLAACFSAVRSFASKVMASFETPNLVTATFSKRPVGRREPTVPTLNRIVPSQIPALTKNTSEPVVATKPVPQSTPSTPSTPSSQSGYSAMPEIDLLEDAKRIEGGDAKASLEEMADLVVAILADYGVVAEVRSILPGPVVTRFEVQPAAGVKVSRITALVKDLARSLAVSSVRVVEVVPGKSVVGIEIPNQERATVRLREIIDTPEYKKAKSPLTLALGKDVSGAPVYADVTKMPHLLVAGTTGSGKSVGINAMLLSMLYKVSPDEVRFVLIDPKMLELSVYEGIPHLLAPVVTDMNEAVHALHWCVAEMERRYALMMSFGVRNLDGFNDRVREAKERGKPLCTSPDIDGTTEELTTLPLIVVIIDEFADMMMIVGKKVDQIIARIAQKARAAGIHLILATQRPSVDVITGLIKANILCRISFLVPTKVDSRTILDQGGAEQLLGNGDMLYMKPGSGFPGTSSWSVCLRYGGPPCRVGMAGERGAKLCP